MQSDMLLAVCYAWGIVSVLATLIILACCRGAGRGNKRESKPQSTQWKPGKSGSTRPQSMSILHS